MNSSLFSTSDINTNDQFILFFRKTRRKCFLGALLSTIRSFPLEDMEELFVAVGRHSRMTLVLWGDQVSSNQPLLYRTVLLHCCDYLQDTICDHKEGMRVLEDAFRRGFVVDVLDCGHSLVFEKVEEVARELLSFHKLVFSGGGPHF